MERAWLVSVDSLHELRRQQRVWRRRRGDVAAAGPAGGSDIEVLREQLLRLEARNSSPPASA